MRREREVKSQSLHWWNMLGLGDQPFPQLLTLNSDIQEGTKLESYHGEALLNKSLETLQIQENVIADDDHKPHSV